MRAPGPRGQVRDWRELPLWAAVVVEEVGETRTAQCPHGDRPGVHNKPDNREARPRPKAHGKNRRSPSGRGTPGLSLLTYMALKGV